MNGRVGYITLAIWGVDNAARKGTKSEVSHKSGHYLHHPGRGRGSITPPSVGQTNKGPINGLIGYITLAFLGVPNAPERRSKSELANKLGNWLHHPRRQGIPNASECGTKSQLAHKRGDWQATSLLLSPGGLPTLHSGRQNQRWPTNGRIGYITSGVGVDHQCFGERNKIRKGP